LRSLTEQMFCMQANFYNLKQETLRTEEEINTEKNKKIIEQNKKY
jgi:hypothetical protein